MTWQFCNVQVNADSTVGILEADWYGEALLNQEPATLQVKVLGKLSERVG